MSTGRSVTYAELGGIRIGAGSDYRFTKEPAGIESVIGGGRAETPSQDGVRPLGADSLDSMSVVFEVKIEGSVAEQWEKARALRAAWGPVRDGVARLLVNLDGAERIMFGRPRRSAIDSSESRFGITRARLVFEATDPRMFSASKNSVTLGLTSGGGVTAPVTAPVTAGAGSDSDAGVVNGGGFETEWTAVITGPTNTPRLTLGETGEFIELEGNVPAGAQLVLDSSDGSVLLNGSPRPNWPSLASKFWTLPAGASTVRFRAASGSGNCTFAWRDADL